MGERIAAVSESEHEVLQSIDSSLRALLALAVEQHLRTSPDLPDPRPRSIDKILFDSGFTVTENGDVLGKSKQAVSQMLKKG